MKIKNLTTKASIAGLYLLLFLISFNCSESDEVVQKPDDVRGPSQPSSEYEAFQKLYTLKQFDHNLSPGEIQQLADEMSATQTQLVTAEGNATLEKFYRLKAEDARAVYKLIGEKRMQNVDWTLEGFGSQEQGKIYFAELEASIEDLENLSAQKYNRSFYQLRGAEIDNMFETSVKFKALSAKYADKSDNSARVAETCPLMPSLWTAWGSNGNYWNAASVSYRKSAGETLCDYVVNYNSTGSFWGTFNVSFFNFINNQFNGRLGAFDQQGSSGFWLSRLVVGRIRANLFGWTESTVRSNLKLVE